MKEEFKRIKLQIVQSLGVLCVLTCVLFSTGLKAGTTPYYVGSCPPTLCYGTSPEEIGPQMCESHGLVFDYIRPYGSLVAARCTNTGDLTISLRTLSCDSPPSPVLRDIYFKSCEVPDKPKANQGCPDNRAGNPCNVATGNKFQSETDFSHPTIGFSRSYNSQNLANIGLGRGWRSNHQKKLIIDGSSLTKVSGTGRGEPWSKSGGVWQGEAYTKVIIIENTLGYQLTQPNGVIEQYNTVGQLLSVSQPNGSQKTFAYDTSDRLSVITNQYGLSLAFAYTDDKLSNNSGHPSDGYEYIVGYYNQYRPHQHNGGLSPNKTEEFFLNSSKSAANIT